MKKLENADAMLRCLPSFLASSAAEGLPIEEELIMRMKELLKRGLDPTEEIDAFYDEKLRHLSPENTKDLDTFS